MSKRKVGHDSDWTGIYNYMNFCIWSPGENEWMAEPNFQNPIAIDIYKGSADCISFSTIAKAKKWIKENGHTIKEENYLPSK